MTGGARRAVRRQQTLHASVDWSHALLTDTERVLFRRLAVFLGGFDLEAAQAVAGDPGVERYQTLDQLTLLVDKSLLVAENHGGRTRYRLLETVRQYALEKLGDSSHVVMRVPPREVEQWKEFFRAAANLRIHPGVLEDPSLSPGECLLATELGTIELGVRAQLEEIEKGFFDLLDRRPVEASTHASPNGRIAV